jgi:hypothetical protein
MRVFHRRVDWRIAVVVIAFGISLLLTVSIYLLAALAHLAFWEEWLSPTTHIGAVFAAWVGGVVLFSIVGLVAAVVSLARPETESFDARARILFRGKTGEHIEYIISTLKDKFEHYSELTSKRVTILDYAAGTFRVSIESDIVLRSYIDDTATTYTSNFRYEDVTPAPMGRPPNRLVYIRVGGAPKTPATIFDTEIVEPVQAEIAAGETCRVETKIEFWVRETTEKNTHIPARFTQKLILEFHNNWDRDVIIKLIRQGQIDQQVGLRPGDRVKALELSGLRPGEEAYDYRFLGP